LFLKDAGIEVDNRRYAYDTTWPETSARLEKDGITKTGKLPALEWKGTILTQVRYLPC
jgi:prostaglandin-H2 D-isomerase / glutathione transferase